MNGAEKIVNAMKKVNQSNQTIPSEIVSVTLTGTNPFTFKVENRLELTPGFYELSELIDWTKVHVGDVFKAFTFNEGQKYFILEAFVPASGGGSSQPAESSVINQLKQSANVVMPIGSGCDYFGSIAPDNFMFADGRALTITEYPELYAVIGETYRKVDNLDITTFNIPDKRERINVMLYDGSSTFNELGKTGGEVNHTLTSNEMPPHNHKLMAQYGSGGGSYNDWHAEFNFANNTNVINVQSGSNKVLTNTGPTTGDGLAHNNLQPYLVCNYIIRVK